MPEADDTNATMHFDPTASPSADKALVKGAAHLGWGMKNRLGRIFHPASGRTVMLAFDHGYCMGPTSGLEQLERAIAPLVEHADCLMCTRGAVRAVLDPAVNKPIALRVSAGNSILDEKLFETEVIGVAIEDAIRLNASAMAVQVCIGAAAEAPTIDNLVRTIDAGNRYGIAVLGVTAVGKQLTRDARYLGLATRILAELGAHFVKSYFCEEGFEKVVAGCPVPIIIAGGKKLPEREALTMAHRAINEGAAGVDMGRNIFQSDCPVAMLRAVRAIVHDGATPEQAHALYRELKNT